MKPFYIKQACVGELVVVGPLLINHRWCQRWANQSISNVDSLMFERLFDQCHHANIDVLSTAPTITPYE